MVNRLSAAQAIANWVLHVGYSTLSLTPPDATIWRMHGAACKFSWSKCWLL